MGKVIPLRRTGQGQTGHDGPVVMADRAESAVALVPRRSERAERMRAIGYRMTEIFGADRLDELALICDRDGVHAALTHLEHLPGRVWGPRGSYERVALTDLCWDALEGRCSLSASLRRECLGEARHAHRIAGAGGPDAPRLALLAMIRASQATVGIVDPDRNADRIVDEYLNETVPGRVTRLRDAIVGEGDLAAHLERGARAHAGRSEATARADAMFPGRLTDTSGTPDHAATIRRSFRESARLGYLPAGLAVTFSAGRATVVPPVGYRPYVTLRDASEPVMFPSAAEVQRRVGELARSRPDDDPVNVTWELPPESRAV